MRYLFSQERKEIRGKFNRERLVLAAMQNVNQLYYMMDTQFEGLYDIEAYERRRQYGPNEIKLSGHALKSGALFADYGELDFLVNTLSKQKAAVFRKGTDLYVETDIDSIVPGDIVFLSSGDVVPADVRILYDRELLVDQHIFTSDEDPVLKRSSLGGYSCSMSVVAGIPDICLMGTQVISGMARALVIGTGSATYLGKIVYGY